MKRQATQLRFTRPIVFACAFLGACAQADLTPDYEAARELVAQRTGREAVYDPAAELPEPPTFEAELADGLTLDEALHIALLNNRRLQASFAELGIARADQVQAGLLQNPELGLAVLFPSGGGRSRLNAGVAQSVMDLWRIPEREQLADARFELKLLEIAHQAGQLVGDVEATYWRCLAAIQVLEVAERGEELATEALQLVAQRLEHGVATRAAQSLAETAALQAGLTARLARSDAGSFTRRLGSLLSLEDDLQEVGLADTLQGALSFEDPQDLVARALRERLDLRAAAAAVQVAAYRVAVERGEALPDVQLGVGYERPEVGSNVDHVLGPTLGVEIPIFDDNSAGVSRAEYELLRSAKLLEALQTEVLQQVRSASDRARLATETLAFTRESLEPQAQRLAEGARRARAEGRLTQGEVLELELAVIAARRAGIAAALEAALAIAELERAVGSPLVEASP